MSAKVIMFSNQKGGVGKTTISCEVCAMLARNNKKVLAIDLDSQCDLSYASRADLKNFHNIKILLQNFKDTISNSTNSEIVEIPVTDAIQSVPEGYDIIVATPEIAALADFISPEDIYLLKDIISEIEDNYDFIILDCAPARSNYLYMAYYASNYCIVPSDCDDAAINGAVRVVSDIKLLQKRKLCDIKNVGLVLIKDDSTNECLNAYEKLVNLSNSSNNLANVFLQTIPKGIAATEAKNHKMSLHEYNDYAEQCDSKTKREIKRKSQALVKAYDSYYKEIMEFIS